jgi:DNA-directed RNA polymerase specialized sigma24 family protein
LSTRRDTEFTEYVQAWLTWLLRVAYLLCQDWDRADDLVQATVTRLYVHWGKARSADQIDGYVRRILVRGFWVGGAPHGHVVSSLRALFPK